MKVWREPAGGAAIADKVYPVTPSSITVKTGMITGEVIELKVTERVERGSERVVSPARLTGKLRLENTSANRTVRLVEGKLLFIDAQGQRIKLDAAHADPIVKFTTPPTAAPERRMVVSLRRRAEDWERTRQEPEES